MNFLRKSAILLVFITVFSALLCFYGCKKSSASSDENGLIVVSEEIFNQKVKSSLGDFSFFSIKVHTMKNIW